MDMPRIPLPGDPLLRPEDLADDPWEPPSPADDREERPRRQLALGHRDLLFGLATTLGLGLGLIAVLMLVASACSDFSAWSS